jgi:hypothetical protein
VASVEHLRKPPAERTGPLRRWSPPAGAPDAGPAPEPDAAPAEGSVPEPPEEGAPGAVGLGYRVIEEYLRQGRRAAEELGLAAGASAAAGSSFQALTARLLRDGLVWLEHLARATAVPGDGAPRPDPAAPDAALPGAGFRVRVAAAAALEVDLRLYAGAEGRALAVHDLRASEPESPPLRGVELTRQERFEVALRVPDAQPPGLYTGIVYDRRDGSICGTLAVRVGEARARP